MKSTRSWLDIVQSALIYPRCMLQSLNGKSTDALIEMSLTKTVTSVQMTCLHSLDEFHT